MVSVFLLCVSAVFVMVNTNYSKKIFQVGKKISAVNSRIEILEKEEAELKQDRIEMLDIKDMLVSQAAFVKRLNRISWSRVFGEVTKDLPDGLSFTSFKIDESGKVDIKGEALRIEPVAAMMRSVESSAVLKDAKFGSLGEKKLEKVNFFSFGILARLREDNDGKE